MSVPSSVEELLQLIRKSGMVEEAKLTAYLQRRQVGRGLPTDPREAADGMVQDGLITYFQAEQFLLGKWRGFTIGKYKLLERVGVGGMGQVFLCEHMFMKRRVAIKVLPPAKAEQPAALGRFYREARAAGSLEHPHIVRTHDIDQDGNLHFIVMEYVDGSNLLEIVKKFGPMSVPRATYYMRQVAEGLEFAFQSGIIHRDIKPGNILVDRTGKAKILDMGLARFYRDQTDMLTVKYDDKIVLGTADYVAPEQVANSHSVDIRADIYALGASIYYLLAGHPPFPSGTVSQKLLWHRTKDPTPISQVRPEVPEGLAQVIAKMMAKDPNQRYQTPSEVVAALSAWVPEKIDPPTAEEMPLLSPAAVEGSNPEEASNHEPRAPEPTPEPVTMTRAPAAQGPFAPARGPFSPSTAAAKPAEPARPVFANASPFRSSSRPELVNGQNPFGVSGSGGIAQAEVPTNGTTVQETTPPPVLTRSPFIPQAQHASARTVRKAPPSLRMIAMVGLVGASLILASGIVYWKYVRMAPTEQATPAAAQ